MNTTVSSKPPLDTHTNSRASESLAIANVWTFLTYTNDNFTLTYTARHIYTGLTNASENILDVCYSEVGYGQLYIKEDPKVTIHSEKCMRLCSVSIQTKCIHAKKKKRFFQKVHKPKYNKYFGSLFYQISTPRYR